MTQALTGVQLQQLMEVVEGTYGDSKGELQCALHDLILVCDKSTLRLFLQKQLKEVTRDDYADPTVYDRTKLLIAALAE